MQALCFNEYMDSRDKSRSRSGTAVRKRGKVQVESILATAHQILVEEGIAALTTRRVARDLGISVGNLAYYFSTRDDLLRALIESVIESYDRELRAEAESFPDQPAERIRAFLRYMIADARRPEVHGFFYQLWGLSTHDAMAARARENMYCHFAAQTAEMLQSLFPEESPQQLDMRALTILNTLEGLHVMFGSGRNFLKRYAGFEDVIYRQLLAGLGVD